MKWVKENWIHQNEKTNGSVVLNIWGFGCSITHIDISQQISLPAWISHPLQNTGPSASSHEYQMMPNMWAHW